jgi:hypothetical protein
LEQTKPGPQTWLQAPQFVGSLCVLTHWPPQRVWPPEHVYLHTLFWHVTVAPEGGAPQAVPHPPQLSGSLEVLTHAPLQDVYPVSQLIPHCPPAHVALPCCGTMQPLLHEPQLLGSFCVSTHCPEHSVVGQLVWQAPATQNSPLGQATPQPPQLLESCWMSTH